MKTNLLSSLGFSLLAFASIGQQRQTGVPQSLFTEANPNQITYQEYVAPRIEPSRPVGTIVNRAPCIDTLLYEDFQSQVIPATWTNLDLDGNTDANSRPMNWYNSFDVQTTLPGDTNYVGTSSSWFNPFATANNVLIMTAVAPCANTVMKWKSAPFEGPTFMDGYKIKVSTTGTNIADFTTTIFTAAESVNGTATPSAGTVHTSYNGTSGNGILQEWSVNLGAYDNQTIYIGFFHDSDDDNLIMIDDIFVGTVNPFDLSIVSTVTEPYYSTPITQVTPRTFTSQLTLAPDQSVTTPTAAFEIFQGATSVFTNTQSAATLAPNATLDLTSTGYTPVASDVFTTVITASAVEADPNLLDNIDSMIFVVSDSVFATADLTFDGSLGIGAGTTGFLGNQYTVSATDDLTSITFVLSTPTIGDTVVGAIYDMVGTTPNVLIAMTDTLFVTVDTPAEYTLPIIGGFPTLTPGNYIVGIQEGTFANVSLATNTEYYTPLLSWVFFNGNWGNNESFGFPNTYLLRANFGISCTDPIAGYTQSANDLTVDFTDLSTDTDSWVWDLGDGTTSTMQNPSHTYAAPGTYTVCLISTGVCGSDTVCLPITVTTCPNPVASYTEVVTVGSVAFTSTSTVGTNPIFTWDFGDGQTSTLENPTNVYAANGSYTVCLTITDSCGVDSTCSSVAVSTIGIDENNMIDGLSLYPIPAQGTMNIENLTSGEDFKLELLNNLGQVVKVIHTEGLEAIQLDLSAVVDGYYHLRISNSTLIGTRAVLIKH